MKTILIYSGGLDSTVLLYQLLADDYSVNAMGINYGQRHQKELVAAKGICDSLGVDFKVVDLSALKPFLAGSSQTDDTVAVPHGHYEEESMKLTIVPNRNMIMLSIAIAYAVTTKSDSVAYAAHGGDHAIYPDCREEFVKALSDAAMLADWHKVQIERPFILKTKAEIVALGSKLNAPLRRTWSCYEGGEIHCGKCGTCVERREAFQIAKIKDDTFYRS